jgi:hypothetical protein
MAQLLGLPPVLREEALDSLSVLSEIGLALILTNIGAQFRAENLRRWGGRILIFSLVETAGSFLLVGASTCLTNFWLLGYTVGGWTVLETSPALVLADLVIGNARLSAIPCFRKAGWPRGPGNVFVRKRFFSALTASNRGFACAAY